MGQLVVENLNQGLEVDQGLDQDLDQVEDQDLGQGDEQQEDDQQQEGDLLRLQSVDALLKQILLLQTKIIMNNNIMLEQKP
jgi:hypothetical protein